MRKLLAILVLLLSTVASAQNNDDAAKIRFEGLLNKLLAPGPLMLGHDNLEHKDCLKCHEAGGGIPNQNCLSCHKPIQDDINAKKHYHGLMGAKPCIECHKEHKGREFNAVFINEKTFDHSKTGFVLDGSHAKAACSSCHTEKRTDKPLRKDGIKFRTGKSQSCISCHKADDIHHFEGKFKGKECSSCHNTTTFKGANAFNHLRETGYALIGAHAKQKCDKCHVAEGPNNFRYQFPSLRTQQCLTCHKDKHGDNLSPRFKGGNCLNCHTQESWPIPNFAHEKTGWVLAGAHARAQCVECHKQNPPKASRGDFRFKGLNRNCASCHSDYHGYGKETAAKINNTPLMRCETCHNESAWKQSVRFDHGTQTRFTIDGKHEQNRCFDCHTPKAGMKAQSTPNTLRKYFFSDLPKKSCETCHKSPHPPTFHKKFKNMTCAQCHTTAGWDIVRVGGDKNFHSKTRFPLTGKHQSVDCKTCHVVNGKEQYKFPNADKNFCVNCHKTPHKEQFKEATLEKPCSTCHTTQSFDKRPLFDHDTTGFKLTGKHKEVGDQNCFACHVATNQKLPTNPPKVAHLFRFDERKDPQLCANCHTTPHKKQFREETLKKSCATCHTTAGFDKQLAFDHDTARFKLPGYHQKIAKECNECHRPSKDIVIGKPPRKGRMFMFPGENRGFCENCHANEHKNMFQPKFSSRPCTSCHTPDRFRDLKKFDHGQTDFEIKGKHVKVRCEQCHTPTKERFKQGSKDRKGKFRFPELEAKSCATCHQDPHRGANGPNCAKCHNENGWKSAGDFHKDFELVGIHLQTDCKACHETGRVLRGSSQECIVCHAKDDNHNGQLQQCGDCHLQNFWQQTLFNHNMTRFPLQGAHRVTECRACHNQGVYQGLPTDCRGCHFQEADAVPSPVHRDNPRYFQCERCHNTFNFPGAVAP